MSDIWQLLRDHSASSTSKEVEPGVWSHSFTSICIPLDAMLEFMEIYLAPGEKPQVTVYGTSEEVSHER